MNYTRLYDNTIHHMSNVQYHLTQKMLGGMYAALIHQSKDPKY